MYVVLVHVYGCLKVIDKYLVLVYRYVHILWYIGYTCVSIDKYICINLVHKYLRICNRSNIGSCISQEHRADI